MGVVAAWGATEWLAAAAVTTAAVGTYMQVQANNQAADEKKAELVSQSQQEKAAAIDRELQRKRRLSAILGAQAAEAAASGLAMSGSVANISINDAKIGTEDNIIDAGNTRARINSYDRTSRSIGKIASYQNAGTIMSGAERIFSAGGSFKGSSTKKVDLGTLN